MITEIRKWTLCLHHVGFNDPVDSLYLQYFLNRENSTVKLCTLYNYIHNAKLFFIVVMADQISKLLKPRKTADIFWTKYTQVFSIKS